MKAYRASLLHCLEDPATSADGNGCQYIEDGILLVDNGRIVDIGEAERLLPTLQSVELLDYSGYLITPGFIDTHVHYPQTGMIASYGEQLLDWLNTYTFPAEGAFADPQHAEQVAGFFLQQLLSNGTTTALVFSTVHKHSADALFRAAEQLDMCLITGKVLMDRNAPDYLTDTAESGYEDSKELIERWHGKGRLHYAVTPRFAPTSTEEQLTAAGKLFQEYPGLYMQTHLSENRQEIEWVKSLFPQRANYLDVYDHYRLTGPRAVFAHAVHLCDEECQRLSETGSAVAFCPTSNLFLGSGLFPLDKMEQHGVRVGLGTDVGGGTSFNQLQSLAEAYKVMQLQGKRLSPQKSLYLATLGGARALYLEDRLGNLLPGKDADFIVLDMQATPLLDYRMQQATNIEEKLFALMILGDDRAISETFIAGRSVYRKASTESTIDENN